MYLAKNLRYLRLKTSLMLHEGVDLKTISDILGHSSISITADIYSHVIEERKKSAAKKLDKYINKF